MKYPPARKSLIFLEAIKIVKISKCPPERISLIILETIEIVTILKGPPVDHSRDDKNC